MEYLAHVYLGKAAITDVDEAWLVLTRVHMIMDCHFGRDDHGDDGDEGRFSDRNFINERILRSLNELTGNASMTAMQFKKIEIDHWYSWMELY